MDAQPAPSELSRATSRRQYVPSAGVITFEGETERGAALDSQLFRQAKEIIESETLGPEAYKSRLNYVYTALRAVKKSGEPTEMIHTAALLDDSVAYALQGVKSGNAPGAHDQDLIEKSREESWELRSQASPEDPAQFLIAEDTVKPMSKKERSRLRSLNQENNRAGEYVKIKKLEERLKYVEQVLNSVRTKQALDAEREAAAASHEAGPETDDLAYAVASQPASRPRVSRL